jgi:hypothetical protein
MFSALESPSFLLIGEFYKAVGFLKFVFQFNNMIHSMMRVLLVILSGNLVISVPFEEDDKDPSIWFLDHNYHESMFSMFKRINGILVSI